MRKFKTWITPKITDRIPTKWGWVVFHPDNLKLGKMTDIGYGCFLNAQEGITIGDYVQLGPYVTVTSANTINDTYGKINIMRHATVGAYTLILPNVVIGEGAHIGSHCTITRNVMGMQQIKSHVVW